MSNALKFTVTVDATFSKNGTMDATKVRLDFGPEFPVFNGPDTPHTTNFNFDNVRSILDEISTTVLERVMGYVQSHDKDFIAEMDKELKSVKDPAIAEERLLKKAKTKFKNKRDIKLEETINLIVFERVRDKGKYVDKVSYSIIQNGTLPPPPPPKVPLYWPKA